jgi:hypothetical protein
VQSRERLILAAVARSAAFLAISASRSAKKNDATVRRIAEGIYRDRAFDRLPILHDAPLDSGCDDEQVLEHCRSNGPRARG